MRTWFVSSEHAAYDDEVSMRVESSYIKNKIGKYVDGYKVSAWAWLNRKVKTLPSYACVEAEAFLPGGTRKEARARARELAREIKKSLAYMVIPEAPAA